MVAVVIDFLVSRWFVCFEYKRQPLQCFLCVQEKISTTIVRIQRQSISLAIKFIITTRSFLILKKAIKTITKTKIFLIFKATKSDNYTFCTLH